MTQRETTDPQLDRGEPHDLPAGAGGPGGHHPLQRGGTHLQSDEKGLHRRQGVYRARSPYVTVVGGVNMDIGGRPYKALVGKDSNPGAVRMSPGGVGRNIAHNMSLMGLDVRLVTAFGDDVYAQKLAAVCGELGIDISQSPVIPGGHTSTYLFINDEAGDMAAGRERTWTFTSNLTPGVLASRRQLLDGSPGGGAGHQPPGGEHRLGGGEL